MSLKSSSWPNNDHPHFQEAFLAALALAGCKTVSIRNGEHHDRFRQAMDRLKVLRTAKAPGSDEIPLVYPTAVTGFYKDIENAVFFGQGFTAWWTPFTGVVNITLSEHEAQRLMDDFWDIPKDVQAVLSEMAKAFMVAPEPRRTIYAVQ
jgi:hypothetical protein